MQGTRLIAGNAELLLLDTLLDRFKELDLIKTRGRQRADSTHVMAAVRSLNRLERIMETLRGALNQLAVTAPNWLPAFTPAEWYQRYGSRVENYHLPKPETAHQDLARVIAADGEKLLTAIDAAEQESWLAQIPAVAVLRRLWSEQLVAARSAQRGFGKHRPPAARIRPLGAGALPLARSQPTLGAA